ncbi:cytochrome P450 [Streptosporangiaceae bacterium NEAU-GS5]|nr:cytochrome P450 [Streptosporangiaceae bacterium NEAU-GS5]
MPAFARDPVNALADFATRADGRLVRLHLGPFRPYLVAHPDHVAQVLHTDWEAYQREGMFWRPLRRLLGASILGEGEPWRSSRDVLQPLFTSRYVRGLTEQMAVTIGERMDELQGYADRGEQVDAARQMAGIINQAVIRALFGGRISRADGERLAPAYDAAATSIGFRLLMPFLPYSLRVPGDRRFRKAVATIDALVMPVIAAAREETRSGRAGGGDVITALCEARAGEGPGADRQIRDDLVSVYGAASESTAMTLTWLWPLLDAHPQVAAELYAEIDRVVGGGPVTPDHVPRLVYTRMVLQELLRLYPAGWIFPRMTVREVTLGGVPVKAGSQVLISPYATHRLPALWPDPDRFDPRRFAEEGGHRATRRAKYAYFPFGGGPHQCLGQHLFFVEAPLLVAAILSRFRFVIRSPGPFTASPAASLRPKQTIMLELRSHRPSAVAA